MIRKLLVGAVAASILVAVAGFVAGIGPPLQDDDGTDIESFPTETPAAPSDDAGADDERLEDDATGSGDATTTATPPFLFVIERVETCGETCRDVTTTLTNEQSTAASNVTVYTRVYAGNGTDGDVVWSGTESVGDLGAGESYTATTRVQLSLMDGLAIEREDGWITVQTTVQSDGETMTFTQHRDVA